MGFKYIHEHRKYPERKDIGQELTGFKRNRIFAFKEYINLFR